MTTATMTSSTTTHMAPNQRFADSVRAFWQAMRYRQHQRRAVQHLSGMTEQQLRDIGIYRSEIESAVYGRDAARVHHRDV